MHARDHRHHAAEAHNFVDFNEKKSFSQEFHFVQLQSLKQFFVF